MTTTSTRVEDARLREILAAAEYLNGEPWGFLEDDERVEILIVRAPNDAVVAKSDDYKRASFIADCEPKVIRSILSELLELRAAVTAYETAKLPCAVTVPPATTISAGCLLTTLLVALEHRGMSNVVARSLSQGAGHEQ